MSKSEPYPFVDVALARRLERTEGRAGAGYIDARMCVSPELGAARTEIAGTHALYDGLDSPLTQTFGLGLFEEADDGVLAQLENFFFARGAPCDHEVSPLAGNELALRLGQRGYRPIECSSVLFRPVAAAGVLARELRSELLVRRVERHELALWSDVAAEGWAEFGIADMIRELGRLHAARAEPLAFLAELDGRSVATGTLFVEGGVALLAGASTIPAARRQGAQNALLAARLRYAAEHGCDLASMGALPGSASQKNAERNGFRLAYTRFKWRRECALRPPQIPEQG